MPKFDDSFSFGPDGGRGSDGSPSKRSPAATLATLRERPAYAVLAVLVAVLLLVVVVKTVGGSGEGSSGSAVPIVGSADVRVPAPGDAVAAFLADGRPVFVVHHEDGTIGVVDALSSHVPFGVSILVGWCPTSKTFDDFRGGAKFDEYGRYILGPASSGLVTFDTTDLGTTPAKVQVGAQRLPAPRTELGTPFSGTSCTSTVDTLFHRIGRGQLSASPRAAVGGTLSGWMAVAGVLLVTPDDGARLCASVDPAAGPSCDLGAPVSGIDGPGLLGGSSTYTSDQSTWLVRTDGTKLFELTLVTGGQAV